MACNRKLESLEAFGSSARQSYQEHGLKEQLNPPSFIPTAPGSSTLCSPMRSGPMTSEDEDTLSRGTGASPFALRSCTAAKRSTTRVGREGSGFHS